MIDNRFIEKFKALETPFYFYDFDLLRRTLDEVKQESSKYGYIVHYAVKANANDALLKVIRDAGMGADCVSGNEVAKAIEIGIPREKVAFAGVGKSDKEIRTALENDIFSFNCESIPEIEVIDELAGEAGKVAPVAIRINPDVDPQTHEYITTGLKDNKFGINHWDFDEVGRRLRSLKNIRLTGIHFHIGSQITDISVFEQLSLKVNKIQEWFVENGFHLEHINVGGGLGINYENPEKEPIPDFKSYFKAFHDNLELQPGQQLHFELGRSLVAQCGHLISRVLYVKKGLETQFMILDAGMTELIRPALYKANHKATNLTSNGELVKYDVVGPICESSDTFSRGTLMPVAKRGDLVALHSAGAYGESMASTYNMRDMVKSYNSDELSK
ncbi:diaminopimelate decarboxylase [Prolixibacter sp. NT017]|uniref:diaminopimelate decarboxylase n=1 Tax=Prolixibacter sp. NT017 TaxID=2652390 RepID=UPI001287016E|nr:diaminopimelate decarboxylase [Prolixibacter sp. NT017]GET27696.1 diaminopimelate decarboxylase [Prolixibacter sp. NT017]